MRYLLFSIFLVIFLVSCQGISNNPQNPSSLKTPDCHEEAYQEQEEYMKTEYYMESVPYTDQECEAKELIYSITDFSNIGDCIDFDERCLDYTLGFCVEKQEYCVKSRTSSSLNIRNLDTERGTWIIRFSYSLDGQAQQAEEMAVSLYPQEQRPTGVIWGIEGELNNKKDDRYGYLVINEPTKQVCRDVIKYQEVERERQVTAYRPTTKYREVCN